VSFKEVETSSIKYNMMSTTIHISNWSCQYYTCAKGNWIIILSVILDILIYIFMITFECIHVIDGKGGKPWICKYCLNILMHS
jgi:hypothetical protein